MNEFKPDRSGYIKNWITSSILETDIPKGVEGVKSLEPMPTFLRTIPIKEVIFDDKMKMPEKIHGIGQISSLGLPWNYHQSGTNVFVDLSKFYYIMKKTDFFAACEIWADKDMTVTARIWHHPCIHVWLNSALVYTDKHLRHFPINYNDVEFTLNKGKNELFVRAQALGVLKVNNLFAVQLKNQIGITIKLPGDSKQYQDIIAMDKWLWSIRVQGNLLINDTPPKNDVNLTLSTEIGNWDVNNEIKEINAIWKTGNHFELKEKYTRVILVAKVNGQELVRRLELGENITPNFKTNTKPYDDYLKNYIEEAAKQNNGFYYNILARYLTDTVTDEDEAIIDSAIQSIEKRQDCSDFVMSFIIRLYASCYNKLSETLRVKLKNTILGFRYWVDEPGSDGMAMVTENHSIMFNACQRAAGLLFEDEIFTCSGRTGKAQSEIAITRIRKWFDEKSAYGLYEFNSSSYMLITMGALLMVVDHSHDDNEIKRATEMLDSLFKFMAIHTFKGVTYAPQGRMYRNGIYPYTTSIQAMLSYASPSVAVAINAWLSSAYCSNYKIPNIEKLINSEIDDEYITAGVKIKIKKTDGYIVTSVDINENSGAFTMGDVPGHEHQEHLWFAAIDADCAVFVNHPSVTNDLTGVRPGYWYGNGVYPKLSQNKSTIYCDYKIPDSLPVHFTHCYFPTNKFDEYIIEKNFLFGKKNDSYLAIWCSNELEPFNDVLQDCEFRAYGSESSWQCSTATSSEIESFSEFIKEFKMRI